MVGQVSGFGEGETFGQGVETAAELDGPQQGFQPPYQGARLVEQLEGGRVVIPSSTRLPRLSQSPWFRESRSPCER